MRALLDDFVTFYKLIIKANIIENIENMDYQQEETKSKETLKLRDPFYFHMYK